VSKFSGSCGITTTVKETAAGEGGSVGSYLFEDVVGDVEQRAVAPGARPSFSPSSLGEQQRIEQQLRLLEIFGDVDVLVHPEHLGVLAERKLLEAQQRKDGANRFGERKRRRRSASRLGRPHLDEEDVAGVGRRRRGQVVAARRETVGARHGDVRVVEVGQDGHQEAAVPVVRHAAAVVTLARQVGDGLEGHLVVSVHKQLGKTTDYTGWSFPSRGNAAKRNSGSRTAYLQLPDADVQVGLVKAVRDVPAQRAELLPLLNESVEETQSVQEPLPNLEGGR